jgi:PAS domain S-box-containing protein
MSASFEPQSMSRRQSMTSQQRNAFWLTVVFLVSFLGIIGILIVQATRAISWQVTTLIAVSAVLLIFQIVGLVLIRRGKYELGVWLAFIPWFFENIVISALVSGFGLTLMIVAVIYVALAATLILKGRQVILFVLCSITSGVITLLVDTFIPTERLAITGAQTAIIVLNVFSILILSFFVLRQFGNYALRTKLLVTTLLTALVPLAGAGYFFNNITSSYLTKEADAKLNGASTQASTELQRFISDNLDFVNTASSLHILREYLLLPADQRPNSETESVMYTDLNALTAQSGYITSIGLMDTKGIDVADTNKADIGLDKSKRDFFLMPIQLNSSFMSAMEISNATKELSVYFGAPVHDEAGVIIGTLRIRYSAQAFDKIMKDAAENSQLVDGSGALLDENQIFLTHTNRPDTVLKSVAPLDASTITALQYALRLPQDINPSKLSVNLSDLKEGLDAMDKQPQFAAETLDEANGAVDNGIEEVSAVRLKAKPWTVIFAQPQSVYLAPLTNQNRLTILSTLGVGLLIAVIAVIVASTISRPVLNLTGVARQIASGDLSVQAKAESNDEIGQLADTFNQMTGQLQQSLSDLNQRASQLATVAEVSTATSSILDTDRLLQTVVDLSKARFDLYHSHIYLMDDLGENLVLAAGAGDPGRQMKAKGFSIPLSREQSLVARAAREKKGVTVNDVTLAPDFLPNPLLPRTRAELAVPMIVADNVIGVFDVQSDEVGRFGEPDINIQTALASQVAISVQNVRQYEQTEASLREVQVLLDNAPDAIQIVDLVTGRFASPNENALKFFGLSREEFEKVGPAQMSPPTQPDGRDSTEKAMEKISEAMRGGTTVFEWTHRTAQGRDVLCEVRLSRIPGSHPQVLSSVTEITERKLVEELTKRRANQQEALNRITLEIQRATTVEDALMVSARELGRVLGMRQTYVSIAPQQSEQEVKEVHLEHDWQVKPGLNGGSKS